MIDPAHPFASWFLWIAGAVFLVAFALPLLFAPIAWAKRVGWTFPEDLRLARYFGRCLGAVALGIVLACFRAAPAPAPFFMEMIAVIAVLLTGVHVWGAVERAQPRLETIEIGLYGALAIVAIWIRLTL